MSGAHMEGQQALKDAGISRENGKYQLANEGPSVHREQQMSHKSRTPRQPPVRGFIERKIPALQSIRQSQRLMKPKAKAFACNGIDGPGSVPSKCHVAAGNFSQPPHSS